MRIKTIVGSLSAALLIIGLAGGLASAAPASVYVSKKHCSDSGAGTRQTPYCSVQTGVNNVANGGTVNIDPGTYTEQVLLAPGRNNITLNGSGNGTVIKAPATISATKTIIEVKATGTTIQHLTVAGPGSTGCDSLEYGIFVDGGGQATINDNHITNIMDSPFSGCQNGTGIRVGRQATGDTGSAVIRGNKIDNYQKNGIVIDNAGSSATITQNTVIGHGQTPVIAQNGIEIARGATASITQNTVTDNEYNGPDTGTTATGILLYQGGTAHMVVTQNSANRNDVGFDVDTQGSTYTQNTANKNTGWGIYVEPSSSGNTFTQNTARNTGGSPFYDTTYDVEDDSTGAGTLHTANTWNQNSCKTSLPAELCRQ